MIKGIFNQIIAHVVIISSYIVLGFVLPIIFDIIIPGIFLFTWIIAPIAATLIAIRLLKYLKISKANSYIVISFALNFVYILIYTWYESRKPHIEGAFLDFRGLYFWLFGIGQIVGVLFTLVWSKALKK